MESMPPMNHKPRPWALADLSYSDVKASGFEIVVLPLGATEPHNLHLPYGTDIFEAEIIGNHICEAATAAGAKVALLPTIPFGTETNLQKFPLAINIQPSTMGLVITDIVRSLCGSGIRKIVLLNSHGGNDLKPVLRELYGQIDAHLFLCNWYQAIGDVYPQIFSAADDHAGEMETSLGLAYFPDFVKKNADGSLAADDGAKRLSQFDAINQGWVSITRPWHLLTTNSGAGNPHQATAEKGRQLVDIVTQRLSQFLVELSQTKIDSEFPYQKKPSRP